jgi:hypothetical protein
VREHATAIAWRLRGNRLETAWQFADTVRMLCGYYAEITPDIPADVACPLRGYSVEMVWSFAGYSADMNALTM